MLVSHLNVGAQEEAESAVYPSLCIRLCTAQWYLPSVLTSSCACTCTQGVA